MEGRGMPVLTVTDTVDIGHGRGRLAPDAAASLWRIDAQLGRPADVNSAWRDPIEQARLYAAWLAYSRFLAGGPWAPKASRALPPDESVHCKGEAVDSDDWYNNAAAVWRDNGWRQTARTSNTVTDEPWHGEYFTGLDNHRNDTADSDVQPLPNPTPTTGTDESEEDDDMGFYFLHDANADPVRYFNYGRGMSRVVTKQEWDRLRAFESGANPPLPLPVHVCSKWNYDELVKRGTY